MTAQLDLSPKNHRKGSSTSNLYPAYGAVFRRPARRKLYLDYQSRFWSHITYRDILHGTVLAYLESRKIWPATIECSRHTLSDTFSLSDTCFQQKWKFSKFKPFFLVNYVWFPICFFQKSLNSLIGFICT